MAAPALLRHALARPPGGDPDAALLARFAGRRDGEAFAELVRRHGPVVYRVCRRLLGDGAADDAFQATFLVLATRPAAVRKAGSVGSWLVGVAGRVARQMRTARARRSAHERAGGLARPGHATPPDAPDLVDQFRAVDEELARLPARFRDPVVLCLLQGRTQEEAAADLGGSVRTVRRRLDAAKHLLRTRLERRGVVPAVAAGLAAGVGSVTATVPRGLADRTAATTFDFLAGGAATTAPAAVLAHGVAATMLARKIALGFLSATVGLTALGVGMAGDGPPPPASTQPPPAKVDPPPATPPKPVEPPAPQPDRIPPLNLPPAVTPPPPFTLTPPVSDEWRTDNFTVTAPTAEVARQVAAAAERHRARLATEWLGREMPKWPTPCPVRVDIKLGQTGGATTFEYGTGPNGSPIPGMKMVLFGNLPSVLTTTLPHEVTHCILATHFGKPIPRWADEGIAVTAEGEDSRRDHAVRCRAILNDGRGIPLKVLFTLAEYPKDMAVLFAQGASVCEFFLDFPLGRTALPTASTDPTWKLPNVEPRRAALLYFVQTGIKHNWDTAAKLVYGFDTVDALQEAWVDWLRGGRDHAPPPARVAPPEPADHATVPFRSANFVVTAPTPEAARQIAEQAEAYRAILARDWLGRELPPWPSPCEIDVGYGANKIGHRDYGGWTTFTFDRTAGLPHVTGLKTVIQGDPNTALWTTLPREVLRCVLATDFGTAPPPWAVGGLSILSRDDVTGVRNEDVGQAATPVSLSQLFRWDEYSDHEIDHIRGRLLYAFLMSLPRERIADPSGPPERGANTGPVNPGRAAVLRFVRAGLADGVAAAAKRVYGYESEAAMQAAWDEWLRTTVAPGEVRVVRPAATPVAKSGPSRANFVVEHPNPAIARAVRNELEYQRDALARQWLGRDLPAWESPTRVRLRPHGQEHYYAVDVSSEAADRGAANYSFNASLDDLLAEQIPSESLRLLLAGELRRGVPKWVGTGSVGVLRPADKRADLYGRCCAFLVQGEALTLVTLFDHAEKNEQWNKVEAQGYAVTTFLLSRPPGRDASPHARFTRFVKAGVDGGWDAAAKDVYGFADVADLERQWVEWVKQNPPRLPAKPPADPTRIPPVKLDGPERRDESGRPARSGLYIPAIRLAGPGTDAEKDPGQDRELHSASRTLTFDVGFHGPRSETKRVELCVSRDGGSNYVVADAITPDKNHLLFRAPEDGVYWFQFVTVSRDDARHNANPAVIPPAYKIRVDTIPPVVRLTPAGPTALEWVVEDANLPPDGLRVEARWQGVEVWTRIAPRRFEARDRYTWAGLTGRDPLEVRVVARDRAGNEAVATHTLPAVPPTAPSPAGDRR